MAFIEIKNERNKDSVEKQLNSIKVSLKKVNNKKLATILIGKNIAKKYNINGENRITFLVDEENTRHWMIKSSDKTQGHKIKPTNNDIEKSLKFRIHVTLDIEDMKMPDDQYSHEVEYDLRPGGIVIFSDQYI